MDFFSKCDQIRRKLRIWSHLLKKSLMENFIFVCGVRCNIEKLFLKFRGITRNNPIVGKVFNKVAGLICRSQKMNHFEILWLYLFYTYIARYPAFQGSISCSRCSVTSTIGISFPLLTTVMTTYFFFLQSKK